MILDSIIEWVGDDSVLKADGFDSAVIGIADDSGRLIYSVSKCIKVLMTPEWGMNMEDAYEYFDFNIRCTYVGEQTPIWCNDDM